MKKESRIEKAKTTTTENLSSSIYRYVMGVYIGSGKTLGEIAMRAREFESEMDVWHVNLDILEDLENGR